MSLQIICFSKDRPLQLHGYLTSLRDWGDADSVKVLVAAPTTMRYAQAYREVASAFPHVEFVLQGDSFGPQLRKMLGDCEITAFGVDDAVFVGALDASYIEATLRDDPALVGFSWRMGRNIHSNMFIGNVPQPAFTSPDDVHIRWDISNSAGDWTYPWELDGTVYPTVFVAAILDAMGDRIMTPNQLEHVGSQIWNHVTPRHHMAAFHKSRLVVPTVNVVQSDFPNGVTGGPPIAADLLLDCWHAGLRLDVRAFQPAERIHVASFVLRRANHAY